MTPTVLNMKDIGGWDGFRLRCSSSEALYYVGRIGGVRKEEHFGNPFSHRSHNLATVGVATRAMAINNYKLWLDGDYPGIEAKRRLWVLAHLFELKGCDLVCWCSPKPCHATILLERVNIKEEA